MGKFLVGLLATCAAMVVLTHVVGAGRLASTAVNVPPTAHTGGFPVSWTLVCGGVIVFGIRRTLKGK